MEIHQKKAGPDYHRLKTMVKRSIEQKLRTKNFEARNGRFETSAVVKNQGAKQGEQGSLGDCWQWKANRQCSKGDNCSFRHVPKKRAKIDTAEPFSRIFYAAECETMHREPRVPEAEARVGKWLDGRARITSKEIAQLPFCEKWHSPECLFYKSERGCKFGDKCSYEHRQVYEQPSKKSKKNGDRSAVAMLKKYDLHDGIIEYTTIGLRISGYGAAEVFIDFTEELYHIETDPTCSIHQNRIAFCQLFEHSLIFVHPFFSWHTLIKCSIRSYQRHVTFGSRTLKSKSREFRPSSDRSVCRFPFNMVAEQVRLGVGERISERICEQIADVHVPQVAVQVLGETKTPSRDRTLQGTAEHILDVLVPDMVEQLVKLPKTVSENRIQELTVEHIVVDIPVLQVAEELVEVSKVFPMAFCGADQ